LKANRFVALFFLVMCIRAGGTWAGACEEDPLSALKAANRDLEETLKLTEAMEVRCPASGGNHPISCWKAYSREGNSSASSALAEIYADPQANYFPEIKLDRSASVRYAILAIEQGESSALKFIPPKPYTAEIGMSDLQVLASTSGKPQRVVRNETEHSCNEIWFYQDVVMTFNIAPQNSERMILRSVSQQK